MGDSVPKNPQPTIERRKGNMKWQMSTLRTVLAASVFFIVVSASSASAQKLAGTNRPKAVPEGYVITPFGYFHPSCVRGLASGETVLSDGSVRHLDGTVDAVARVCNHSHYTASGEAMIPGVISPSISHSWIEALDAVDTITPFGELTAVWTVPPAPTTDDDQTVFFFPGMEDIATDASIIQPVLGWNAGFFGPVWTITSWNCCPSGIANYSGPIQVNSGDTIRGEIKYACSKPTKSCNSWNITTENDTTGASTILYQTPSEGQTFNWAQAGALEVYNIVKCTDYPPDGSITFSDVSLYDYKLHRISNPAWLLFNYSFGLTPQCNYGATTSGSKVTLDY
jgi:hypothetical protein